MLNCVRHFQIRVVFHTLYLYNEVGDPHFCAFPTQVTHHLNGKFWCERP